MGVNGLGVRVLEALAAPWCQEAIVKETKGESVKEHFKEGTHELVHKSAEDKGVWQLMVAASALYEGKVHDLDRLRIEAEDMLNTIDRRFAAPESRERPSRQHIDRDCVEKECICALEELMVYTNIQKCRQFNYYHNFNVKCRRDKTCRRQATLLQWDTERPATTLGQRPSTTTLLLCNFPECFHRFHRPSMQAKNWMPVILSPNVDHVSTCTKSC